MLCGKILGNIWGYTEKFHIFPPKKVVIRKHSV